MVLAMVVVVLTWWVHKQRKCRKDTKSKYQTLLESRHRMKAANSLYCVGQPISV